MNHDPQDPATWARASASLFIIGVDLGLMQDHSAKVVAGCWPNTLGQPIGLIDIKQYPIGFPLDTLADEVAADLRKYPNSRCIFDATNNSAWAGTLANRVPRPAQRIIGAVWTNADSHAAQPQTMIVSVAGHSTAIHRWTLSKRDAFYELAAELDAKTLRIGNTGDRDALITELKGIQAHLRASGTIVIGAPEGKHDDLVSGTCLCTFGCRRLGGVSRPRRIIRRERPNVAGWT
jgi:hypothetical protein